LGFVKHAFLIRETHANHWWLCKIWEISFDEPVKIPNKNECAYVTIHQSIPPLVHETKNSVIKYRILILKSTQLFSSQFSFNTLTAMGRSGVRVTLG
jgi:hypothetical protein